MSVTSELNQQYVNCILLQYLIPELILYNKHLAHQLDAKT